MGPRASAQRSLDILKGELDLTLGQIGCPDAAALCRQGLASGSG